MKGLLHGFRHYADFSGRDSRCLYWSFIIGTHFVLILLALPAIVAFMLDLQELLTGFLMRSFFMDMDEMLSFANEYFMEYCATFTIEHGVATWCLLSAGVWGVLIAIPTISATVRRLRDAGQSPWWVLPPCLSFVPIISVFASTVSIITLILCCLGSSLPPVPTPSTPGE